MEHDYKITVTFGKPASPTEGGIQNAKTVAAELSLAKYKSHVSGLRRSEATITFKSTVASLSDLVVPMNLIRLYDGDLDSTYIGEPLPAPKRRKTPRRR